MPPTVRRGIGAIATLSVVGIITLASYLGVIHPAEASDFSLRRLSDNRGLIILSGEIEAGDVYKLQQMLSRLNGHLAIVGLWIDSPGGSILEAGDLASAVHQAELPVIVGAERMCASACFLIFAASPDRFAGQGSRIGVHSASVDGEENLLTQGVTTAMARIARSYGVPNSVIGRMVTTDPSDIAWLTPAELNDMHAQTPSLELDPPMQAADSQDSNSDQDGTSQNSPPDNITPMPHLAKPTPVPANDSDNTRLMIEPTRAPAPVAGKSPASLKAIIYRPEAPPILSGNSSISSSPSSLEIEKPPAYPRMVSTTPDQITFPCQARLCTVLTYHHSSVNK